ncbi:MAG TPA: hypothetical protein VGN18_16895 [Jatrophihabitans sp.]|jgi:undecaprenyl-diphosphatase|uniref:phosphatase PAP2 family protein n=1 Tax=Jatrophihabitans sp. TaxID=1932789 RepID=UPI002DF8F20C|nr:hypothetical protein [Jatrophihabitans sp.]
MTAVGLAPQRVTRPTLIAPRRRLGVLVAVLMGLAGFTALALSLVGTNAETGPDTAVDEWLFSHVGFRTATVMLGLSEPKVTTSILVLVVLAAGLARRWDAVVWAVIAPTLAIVLAEVVFKPLVGRRLVVDLTEDPYYATHRPPGGVTLVAARGYAFPSGHETGVTAVTVELALLALLVPMARRLRAALLVVLALWTLIAAAGLVRNHYHFATDTLGAILLTAACVAGVALATDAVGERRRRGRAQFT